MFRPHCGPDPAPLDDRDSADDARSGDFPLEAQLFRRIDPAEFGDPHPMIA